MNASSPTGPAARVAAKIGRMGNVTVIAYSDARTVALAHVPHGRAVPGRLAVQVRGSGPGHRCHQRITSSSGARGGSLAVDCEMRMISSSPSLHLTTTSLAPACFAARTARARSAWVNAAGRLGIELAVLEWEGRFAGRPKTIGRREPPHQRGGSPAQHGLSQSSAAEN
jgi:hypothetical protein